MNNADKHKAKKKPFIMLENKIKKNSKNGKAQAPKFKSISEAFYNGLIEQCMINGITVTVIKKQKEDQK